MHRHAYHHMGVHHPPEGGPTAEWLRRCLSDARAAFLQRLHVTSSRLRVHGLRLRLHPETGGPPDTLPITGRMGITTQLHTVGDSLIFVETLYDVTDQWLPVWRGRTSLWAEAEAGPRPLPADLRDELNAWLRLVRGSVPVVVSDTPRCAGQG